MNYTGSIQTVLAAALFVAASASHAVIMTAEPDAFAAGTLLNNAYAGVTLSIVGGGFGNGPDVFAVDSASQPQPNVPFNASTGSLVFGTNGTFPHVFREPGFVTLRADFAVLTNFVSIDYIANDSPDVGFLQVFDASDVLLGTYTTASLSTNQFETMSFLSGSANIAYILAGGDSFFSAGGLDNLRFDVAAVPEPATLALLGLGLAGFAATRRRRP